MRLVKDLLYTHLTHHESCTIFYLVRFRAFLKEWYSTLIEGLVDTSRFVNFLCFSRGWSADHLTFTQYLFIFIDTKNIKSLIEQNRYTRTDILEQQNKYTSTTEQIPIAIEKIY